MKNKKKMILNSFLFTFFIIAIISFLDIQMGMNNVSRKFKYVSNIYEENVDINSFKIISKVQGVEFIKNENGKLEAIIKEKFWFPWSQMVITYQINYAIDNVENVKKINKNEWDLGNVIIYKSMSSGREFKSILIMK
ncbi:MAG: hypothetical protein KatS3mg002_0381 [Candidatus Woesearchaeota archaeon]|nr:MAG: hypothetical protein KatS3mg002_0381 [Candidatus Woesearchaeota archaeon]